MRTLRRTIATTTPTYRGTLGQALNLLCKVFFEKGLLFIDADYLGLHAGKFILHLPNHLVLASLLPLENLHLAHRRRQHPFHLGQRLLSVSHLPLLLVPLLDGSRECLLQLCHALGQLLVLRLGLPSAAVRLLTVLFTLLKGLGKLGHLLL